MTIAQEQVDQLNAVVAENEDEKATATGEVEVVEETLAYEVMLLQTSIY